MSRTTFGNYIRELRFSRRFGLREAAKRYGITPGHLSKIERGVANPPKGAILKRMATELGVPEGDLVKRATPDRMIDASTSPDSKMAPYVAALYRISVGRSKKEIEAIIEAIIDSLDLAPDQKQHWRKEFDRIIEDTAFDDEGFGRLNNGWNDLFDPSVRPRYLSRKRIEQISESVLERYSEKAGRPLELPIMVDEVIEFAYDGEIDLRSFSNADVNVRSDGSPPLLGICAMNDAGNVYISIYDDLLDTTHGPSRRRGNFTMAHELFHAIEHMPLARRQNENAASTQVDLRLSQHENRAKRLQSAEDWREWQANAFAAALLMPEEQVNRCFQEAYGCEGYVVKKSCIDSLCHEVARDKVIRFADGSLRSMSDVFDVNPIVMAIRLKTLRLVDTE